MPSPSQRSHHLFVVRTWQETDHVAPGDQWRGSVEHVPSGQRLYFANLEQLCAFVASQCDWPTTNSGPPLPDERFIDERLPGEEHPGHC